METILHCSQLLSDAGDMSFEIEETLKKLDLFMMMYRNSEQYQQGTAINKFCPTYYGEEVHMVF